MTFTIELTPQARDHIKALRKRDQQIIVNALAAQLAHDPDRTTRNRKPLKENPWRPGSYGSVTFGYSTMWTATRNE